MQFQAKEIMLSVVIGFCIIWNLLFPSSAFGNELKADLWVNDAQHVLDHTVRKRITHTLEESALKRNIHVRVFIFHSFEQSDIKELALHTVQQWQRAHPELLGKKQSAYLIVNSRTNEAEILLANSASSNQHFIEGIRCIKKDILTPSLEMNDINKAVWESAIALTMVLEEWPQTVSVFQQVMLWLTHHHLAFLALKWFFYLSLMVLAGLGLKWYFRSPPIEHKEEQSAVARFEAALKESEEMMRRRAADKLAIELMTHH